MRTTEKEALKRLFANDVKAMKQAEQRWAEIEERLKLKQRGKGTASKGMDTKKRT